MSKLSDAIADAIKRTLTPTLIEKILSDKNVDAEVSKFLDGRYGENEFHLDFDALGASFVGGPMHDLDLAIEGRVNMSVELYEDVRGGRPSPQQVEHMKEQLLGISIVAKEMAGLRARLESAIEKLEM